MYGGEKNFSRLFVNFRVLLRTRRFNDVLQLLSREEKNCDWLLKTFGQSALRGPFLTSPLGANFDPQGRSCPPGVSLSPRGEVIPWG
jgi:hypothetical protein